MIQFVAMPLEHFVLQLCRYTVCNPTWRWNQTTEKAAVALSKSIR